MAKLIGTGKDPRFPQGQDYDVNENDLQHHVEAGLGEPVEPGMEAYASHRGYDTIAEDPGEATLAGGPVVQENYGTTSRAAARVETTSAPGAKVASAEGAVEAARSSAARVEQDDGSASTEDGGSLPGQGGAGAESARIAGEDPADAPRSEGGVEGDPGSGETSGGNDDELTGDALKQRAADLGIEGRSSMSASDLRRAVAEREAEERTEE